MSLSDVSLNRSAPAAGSSLYETLGGAATVREAVDRFYTRVLDDPTLVPFFEGVDMPRLKWHQALVIAGILGGPQEYDGVGLKTGHAHLGISDADFDRVVQHLLGVLDEMGAGQPADQKVAQALERVRGDIVTTPSM